MIAVAGEALIDLILSPDGTLTANPGGGPYNAARTIARLGGSALFVGRLSDDRFGTLLHSRLEADGVDLSSAPRTSDPTTLAVAELDAGGAATYHFYFAGTSAPGLTEADLADGLPAHTQALHVGTLGLALEPMASTYEALVAGLDPGVLVLVDPNCRPTVIKDGASYRARLARVLARTDVVKVSGDDLEWLTPGVPALDSARALLDAGPQVVLLTDGAAGVHVLTPTAELSVDVPRVDVVDTVGAGDSFGGAFVHAWCAAGHDRSDLGDLDALRVAVEFAVRVAALTCQRQGADPPFAADLG